MLGLALIGWRGPWGWVFQLLLDGRPGTIVAAYLNAFNILHRVAEVEWWGFVP